MKTVRVITTLAVLFSLAVPAAASAASTDFPLRGWWPLNEGKGQTVYDWSGKGNNGFLGSTPAADSNDPTWTKGIFFGSALNFGGSQFVTIPDDDTLAPQSLTVGAWVRASQTPGTYRYLLAKGGQDCVSSSYGLQTWYHGGLEFFVWDGTPAALVRPDRSEQDLGWQVASRRRHVRRPLEQDVRRRQVGPWRLQPQRQRSTTRIRRAAPRSAATAALRSALHRRHRRGPHLVAGSAGRSDLEPLGLAAGHSGADVRGKAGTARDPRTRAVP